MFKRYLISLMLACFLLPSVWAKEPLNLSLYKQKLESYHDSGQYQRDIAASLQQAMRYLKVRLIRRDFHGLQPAIILDIDETALSNYPIMTKLNFGGTYQQFREAQDQGLDDAIPPTLTLYRFAKQNKVAVFFLTGREAAERQATEANLKRAGFTNWDGLILRSDTQKTLPAATYKTASRKTLTDQGYLILLNIGDQNSDLAGGYADKTFKLPNPYYLIP